MPAAAADLDDPLAAGESSGDPSSSLAVSDGESSGDDDRVFLVPYRWWREAQEAMEEEEARAVRGVPYAAAPVVPSYYPMKLINNMFSSDQVFTLRRADELLGGGDVAAAAAAANDAAAGRRYALVAADLWSRALRWHGGASMSDNNKNSSFAEEGAVNAYPLTLRISVMRETNVLTVKISKKDNSVENYKRANKILTADSEPVHIWDFSGRTKLILMNDWNNRLPQDFCTSDQEIPLEVHLYGLSEPMDNGTDGKKDELALHQSRIVGGSALSNGSIRDISFDLSSGSLKGVGLGLTGLENLGNTCFMNSAVQCLAHTTKLVDYFLGDYRKEINPHNPLGMNGELACAFGDLLRRLWALDRKPVVPEQFKRKLAHFAPQFSGFNQHDSQELLAFLLDGLHEDLNRVKCKPYSEAKDADGRPDEEVGDEYWGNHLARNDSIIVDICQGQYKSTLVCPVCNKVSTTFDPFMYLSLPLPSTIMRTMTVTVFGTDGSTEPSPYTISVPKSGDLKNFIDALSNACSLRDDERLLVAEVYNSRILRYLDEPSDSISLIRDGDRLVAYRLPKDHEEAPVVVFVNQHLQESQLLRRTSSWKPFAVPLVASLPNIVNGSSILNQFLKVLNPFRRSNDNISNGGEVNCTDSDLNDPKEMNVNSNVADCSDIDNSIPEEGNITEDGMQFYLTDDKFRDQLSKIEMSQPVSLTGLQKRIHVLVCWHDKSLEQYDLSSFNSLPEIYKSVLFARRPQDTCSLYACLEAFLKEEPLGPEDMWYCPGCKQHQQASKKLDLWRLPEILIIHLKRFSYSRFMKNKLETFVDFPIHDLDLSKYINNSTKQITNHYRLYAISNHYGNMGGGHYTAYVYHEGQNRWFDFDDRRVGPIAEDSIKTSSAYVLFYRRIQEDSLATEMTTDSDCTT